MPVNVAPLRLSQNADGTGTLVEMSAQDTIALQNLVASLRLLGGLAPDTNKVPFFTGVDGASVVTLTTAGRRFDGLAMIGGDGVLEAGLYIDLHDSNTDSSDYYARITADTTGLRRMLRGETGSRLLFDQFNLVGAVSQSGAVPTGRVIERGGTVNNRYVRWADGTQICHGYIGSSAQVTDQAPVGWHKYIGTASFPAAFSSVPRVSYALISGSTFYGLVANDAPHSQTATASSYLWSPAPSFVGQAGYIAVGRWFE